MPQVQLETAVGADAVLSICARAPKNDVPSAYCKESIASLRQNRQMLTSEVGIDVRAAGEGVRCGSKDGVVAVRGPLVVGVSLPPVAHERTRVGQDDGQTPAPVGSA